MLKNSYLMIFAAILLSGQSAQALSLDAYGITLTNTGIVDEVSGLRWLDADLTLGTNTDLAPLFADGWRIASEMELAFLLSHSDNINPQFPVYNGNSPLQYSEFLVLTEALGINANSDNFQAWVCRVYSSSTLR